MIIDKQFEIKKQLNVLIITPAPTETAPQFTEDLFNKFKDFNKFKIHHIEGSEMIKNIEEVGSDLKFGLPGEAYIGSPSLKIKKLAIAGE